MLCRGAKGEGITYNLPPKQISREEEIKAYIETRPILSENNAALYLPTQMRSINLNIAAVIESHALPRKRRYAGNRRRAFNRK